ncbi:MAG: hypothetical protein ACRYFB_11230 [Janthinobacterium lividum]
MSTTRKQYDREFKVMAVELSRSGSDLSVLSKELEIRLALLYCTADAESKDQEHH